MGVPQLTSEHLERLGRKRAVEAVRRFLRQTAAGRTAAPPRVAVPVGERQMIFTVGASLDDDVAGFRLYTVGAEPVGTAGSGLEVPAQMLGLIRPSTGEVLATAVGADFGVWRTAAIGAIAMELATAGIDRPIRVALIGAGFQARHHARTWSAIRSVEQFRVFTRRPEAGRAFAAALARDTGDSAVAVRSAREALEDADAVLCVTTSPTPVIDADDAPEDAYVATVGPKFGDRHELPGGIHARAAVLITDSVAQCRHAEQSGAALPGGRRVDEMIALADVVAGDAKLPREGTRLFVSTGLAGTEVALLRAVLGAR